jgi:hypothetical protein
MTAITLTDSAMNDRLTIHTEGYSSPYPNGHRKHLTEGVYVYDANTSLWILEPTPYDPTTPSDWSTAPANVPAALDTLAADLAGVGGGGISISYLGYNTAGGSTETMTRYRQLMKKITAPSNGVILNVGAYIKPSSSSNVMGFSVAILADNAGSPDEIISLVPWHAVYSVLLDNSYRWVSIPMSLPVTAGDYWIAISDIGQGSRLHIAYDGSGADKYWATGNAWMTGADGGYTLTSTTNKYSLRAGFLA